MTIQIERIHLIALLVTGAVLGGLVTLTPDPVAPVSAQTVESAPAAAKFVFPAVSPGKYYVTGALSGPLDSVRAQLDAMHHQHGLVPLQPSTDGRRGPAGVVTLATGHRGTHLVFTRPDGEPGGPANLALPVYEYEVARPIFHTTREGFDLALREITNLGWEPVNPRFDPRGQNAEEVPVSALVTGESNFLLLRKRVK